MLLRYDFPKDQNPLKLDIQKNLDALDAEFPECDAILLTSKDPFISEYVPHENNPRYGATGFRGSVGDAIYWTKKYREKYPNPASSPVSLFIDGRYYLQADQETPREQVEVVKCDAEANIESTIRERLFRIPNLNVGMDFERTSVSNLEQRNALAGQNKSRLVNLSGERVLKALHLPGWKTQRPIFSIPEAATGRTPAKILSTLQAEMKSISGSEQNLLMTAATDDAAFLFNARGFHLPKVGSFLAYTFFTPAQNKIILFLPACSQDSPLELDVKQFDNIEVVVIRNDLETLRRTLKETNTQNVFFNGATVNSFFPTLAQEVFPQAKVYLAFDALQKMRIRKTPQELDSIRKSFLRSSSAIAKTLRWGKSEAQKRNVSESELAAFLYEAYAQEGAIALSFSTIAGAGPNSAIVHYTNPSSEVYFQKGQLALLDSGAYYSEGFCTDCTRGFFVGDAKKGNQPEPWQKEIYTLTLKSAIQVFLAPVDAKLSGKEIDQLIRSRIQAGGYDYQHGTGHGVGIHVHEEGIRFSTFSAYPQTPYACVSVEPGIYITGKGGVRIENIALLIPESDTQYRYENVVFVGYDWDLIDLSKLTDIEKNYLKTYEKKCSDLGNQLTECPL